MPAWLIAVIILIAIMSRAVKALRRMQEEAQKQRPTSEPTHARMPWEFEPVEEMPIPEREMEVESPAQRPRKVDDEFRRLVDESAVPDEEAFKEETVAKTQPSEPELEGRPVPPRHKPIQIAGTPLTPRTIRQGIIISEILRRPRF